MLVLTLTQLGLLLFFFLIGVLTPLRCVTYCKFGSGERLHPSLLFYLRPPVGERRSSSFLCTLVVPGALDPVGFEARLRFYLGPFLPYPRSQSRDSLYFFSVCPSAVFSLFRNFIVKPSGDSVAIRCS